MKSSISVKLENQDGHHFKTEEGLPIKPDSEKKWKAIKLHQMAPSILGIGFFFRFSWAKVKVYKGRLEQISLLSLFS
ncbi:hypothetical protein RchiOBHm_Chr4g0423681 [Rosa chinensis]|uniref:Uncharacterized protein n=1 Tax=Rosa chinensis TaxID=74649 RepID=A0A2P6QYN2_ROSCH|nr:hypothetical protein RchiOBHm_Chr4g0423681 [Rosa chinensis]